MRVVQSKLFPASASVLLALLAGCGGEIPRNEGQNATVSQPAQEEIVISESPTPNP